jgi:hypothetical protein
MLKFFNKILFNILSLDKNKNQNAKKVFSNFVAGVAGAASEN